VALGHVTLANSPSVFIRNSALARFQVDVVSSPRTPAVARATRPALAIMWAAVASYIQLVRILRNVPRTSVEEIADENPNCSTNDGSVAGVRHKDDHHPQAGAYPSQAYGLEPAGPRRLGTPLGSSARLRAPCYWRRCSSPFAVVTAAICPLVLHAPESEVVTDEH